MSWGILRGVGKGLTDYAGIMGENRKFNWELQKDELKWNRDQALEALRQKGLNDRQGSRQEFLGEQGDLNRTATRENAEAGYAAQIKNTEAIQSAYDRRQDDAQAHELSPEKLNSDLNRAYELQKNTMKAVSEGTEEQASKAADALEIALTNDDGILSELDKAYVFAARNQLDTSLLFGKTGKMTADVQNAIWTSLEVSDEGQKILKKEGTAGLLKKFTKLVDEYEKSTGTDGILSTKGETRLGEVTEADVPKLRELKKSSGADYKKLLIEYSQTYGSDKAAEVQRMVDGEIIKDTSVIRTAADRATGRSFKEGWKEDVVEPTGKVMGWLEGIQNRMDQSNTYSP